jgi:holliday junction DNA helicase RuvA
MIVTLIGRLTEKLDSSLILECGGIGYELATTAGDWGGAKVGETAKFYIYEQIREDAHNLYGFAELATRELFVSLLAVAGVGPKLAMQILSAAGADRLRQAIASGDPDLLKGIAGVGPKTATRLIVELKGKVGESGVGVLAPVTDAAYQALVALGYTPSQATQAVAAIPEGLKGDQERVKAALKGAGK